jgi:hypothetical protein
MIDNPTKYDYISRSITTHGRIRRLPHQGARHSIIDHGHPSVVSSFFSTCGCFLRGGRSPSGDIPPLSLACGWPLGANGSLACEWQRLQGFRVEDPSGARKGGPNRSPEWDGPAGLGRPAQAHFRPVRSPLRSRGSSGDYALCPFHLHDFDDVILASKMEVLCA